MAPPKQSTALAPASDAPITLDDVEAARGRLAGALVDTDCDWSRTLSGIVGCKLWLKFENQQFTASFKERGALNRLSAPVAEGEEARRDRHVGRQPRAGRRLSRPPALDPRDHRHAHQHADGEGGQYARGTAPR